MPSFTPVPDAPVPVVGAWGTGAGAPLFAIDLTAEHPAAARQTAVAMTTAAATRRERRTGLRCASTSDMGINQQHGHIDQESSS
jgi:hypothetical protein